MPTKIILSPAQRAIISNLPADHAPIERLSTSGPDDLAQATWRRRGSNWIGHAARICYLRHSGRGLLTNEALSDAMPALGWAITASTTSGIGFDQGRMVEA